ncbi:MAG: HEPN domain-containing protein [Betaproteobacteria bacterium]
MADDFIVHLDGAIGGIADPFIRSRYVGFVAVSAATVFELAIKDIFSEFAAKKHKVLGSFVQGYFDQINGQIAKKRIEEKYLPLFGKKYVDRFRRRLDALELQTLRADGVSIKSSYSNLLTWRHEFAHEGVIPAHATYDEVKKSYRYGCNLIHCLAQSMAR